MGLWDVLAYWDLVECDLQDCGVDLSDPVLRQSRSWRWLMTRVIGLLQRESRLQRQLLPPADQRAPSSAKTPDQF